MRWMRATVLSSLVGAVALAVIASCAGMQGQKPAASASDQLARGKYLATIGGCMDCHTPGTFYGTPDTTRHLSGSELGWEGPWGTTYARNLTPDAESGLGNYTAEQIAAAIDSGKRLDGSPMLPPMPWFNYALMTDEDLLAVAQYLKSIPAVSHKVPDRLPPGAPSATKLTFPPPPAWDAMNLPPPPAAGDTTAAGGH